MDIDTIKLNLKSNAKDGIDSISKLVDKFKDLVEISPKVANTLNTITNNTSGTTQKIDKLANSVDNVQKSMKKNSIATKLLNSPVTRLRGSAKDLRDMFNSFSKHTSKGIDTLTNKFKKLGLGLMGVRTVMSILTKSVAAYLSFDSELQDSITNSWNMLGSLLAPAIEFVAEAFAQATAYVYTFLKAITGIDFVARANAKAIETQAKANAKLGKSQQGLMAMDEITNLPTAGTPKGDIPQIEVPEIKGHEIFSRLIQAIKNGDWYGAGEIIAEGLNTAMDSIPWGKVRKNASQAGTNLAQFLNGGIDNFHWDVAGQTLGNGINTAIDFAYNFVSNFHWKEFGDGIGTLINNSFKTIEWDKLGQTISTGIKGILKSINSFLTTTDFEEIGNDIKTFLINIDWGGIAKGVIEVIINSFKAEHGLLKGFFGDDLFGDITRYTVEGPIGLLADSIDMLKLSFTNPTEALDKFAGKFGISSEEMINGLNSIGEDISKFFSDIPKNFDKFIDNVKVDFDNFIDNISKGFANFLTNFVKQADENFTEVVKDIGDIFSNIFDFITNPFKTGVNAIKKLLKGDFLGALKTIGKGIANAFIFPINSLISGLNFMLTPFRSIIVEFAKITGKKLSLAQVKIPTIPPLATGTNNIESEGIYHLHEGEAVVPKKYNPATGGYDNGSDNKQIIDLLISLNANMLSLSEREMAVYMDSKKVAEGIYDDMQTVGRNKNVSTVMKRS